MSVHWGGKGPGHVNRLPRGVGGFSPATLFSAGEPGAWYDPSDFSTLFQDSAGTTPVTAVAQQVGLMLDKSQGLVLGPELVSNGTFDANTNGWTQIGGGSFVWDASGGIACTDVGGADCNAQTNITTVAGRTYRVQWTVRSATGGWLFRIRNATDYTFQSVTATTGTYTAHFVASVTGTNTVNLVSSDTNQTVVFDNISVKLLPGNHAFQSNSGQRPTLGRNPTTGRLNLLQFTEDFTNAYWTKTNITLGAGVTDPNGGNAAFSLTAGAANATMSRNVGSVPAGGAISCSVKRRTGTGAVALWDGNSYVDIPVTSSWVRVSISQEVTTTGFFDFRIAVSGDAVDVAFPQVQTGVLTPYQKVVSSFDVTEAGKPDLYYVNFDGTDDGMLTNTITPGIDKAQVFSGVQKLSNAAAAILLETSVNWNTNAGSMYASAPESVSGQYRSASRGSAAVSGGTQGSETGPLSAPNTSVLAVTHDISGDNTTLRQNTVAFSSGTGDKGTGNFLAYPLYLGRRGGTTLPFNGNVYSMIVRFGANLTADQIAATETWVNGKTGAY